MILKFTPIFIALLIVYLITFRPRTLGQLKVRRHQTNGFGPNCDSLSLYQIYSEKVYKVNNTITEVVGSGIRILHH